MGAPRILTDDDVAKLPMSTVVACMERALKRLVLGELVAPTRISTGELHPAAAGAARDGVVAGVQDQLARSQRSHLEGAGQLVFTPGAIPGAIGFRVYDLVQLNSPQRVEIVAVLSTEDGSLTSLVTGPLLGAMRTGGIGGVALRHLVRPSASVLALIGAGYQARTQLMAACAIGRTWSEVRVYARRREQAEEFAAEMMSLSLAGVPSGGFVVIDTAEVAVRGADVVICTTTATTPVIRAEWLAPGTHVTNVGPKFTDGAE